MSILVISYAVICISGIFHLMMLLAFLLGYTIPEFLRFCKFRALADAVEADEIPIPIAIMTMFTFYIPQLNLLTGGIIITIMLFVFLKNAILDIHIYMRNRRSKCHLMKYGGR